MTEDWLQPSYEPGLVSVIIPCRDQERFLPACLKSVVDQDYRPLEIIIVDDESTDGTRQIMDGFRACKTEGIGVSCIYQKHHGAQRARNEGCRQARGEFIQFLDSDDVLLDKKLTRQVKAFKEHREVDVIYGEGQYLVDFGGMARKGRIISIGPSSDIVESLLYGSWVPPFSYLSRRSAVQLCGPWDERLDTNQDFEYFLRMAAKGALFRYSSDNTGFYRKHSFSTLSEQSIVVRCTTRRTILADIEDRLREQGEFTERRVRATIENYRRIARQAYPDDMESFRRSLDDVVRLRPDYLPSKPRARLIASIIGFRSYELLAARVSYAFLRNRKDWL